jgi:disulfide bond formation protein DsbB
MASDLETADRPVTPAESEERSAFLSTLVYWGANIWMLGYTVVMLMAFSVQFLQGEYPCPLCMLQRYAMILSTIGALWIIMQARRGELTTARYAQGLGMGVLAAVTGTSVSIRQILLHILPDDQGYGSKVLGLHLYTWADITFAVVVAYVAIALMLTTKAVPQAPPKGSLAWRISTGLVWLFLLVVAANVVAIVFLEGFAWVLPDDPNSYNLIEQLTGR